MERWLARTANTSVILRVVATQPRVLPGEDGGCCVSEGCGEEGWLGTLLHAVPSDEHGGPTNLALRRLLPEQ